MPTHPATPEPATPNETTQQPVRTPLDAVIDEVRRDAQSAPSEYARETIVPEGGE